MFGPGCIGVGEEGFGRRIKVADFQRGGFEGDLEEREDAAVFTITLQDACTCVKS